MTLRPGLQLVLAFLAGIVFALGLAIAGMTQPSKVVGFLDVTGAWDPSLAFVMLGAIPVYAGATKLASSRLSPFAGGSFRLPTRRDIEPSVLLGAGIFGVGWGLAGYCPGPGLTSLGVASLPAFIFVVAMALGMLLFEAMKRQQENASRLSSAAARDRRA